MNEWRRDYRPAEGGWVSFFDLPNGQTVKWNEDSQCVYLVADPFIVEIWERDPLFSPDNPLARRNILRAVRAYFLEQADACAAMEGL